MRDLKRMQERFLRDPGPIRLGNLASNLLRLSHWVHIQRKEESVVDLMREIAWQMEWTGDLALEEVADMQREICRWRRIWPADQFRSILSLRAVQMSKRVLKLSGLSAM